MNVESRARDDILRRLETATEKCSNAYAKGKRSFEILASLTLQRLTPHWLAAALRQHPDENLSDSDHQAGACCSQIFPPTSQPMCTMSPFEPSRRSFLKTLVALAGTAHLTDGLLQAQSKNADAPLLAYAGKSLSAFRFAMCCRLRWIFRPGMVAEFTSFR